MIIKKARLSGFDANVDVRIDHETIANIANELTAAADEPVVEGYEKWLVPGFIDLHIHGAGGADVFDGTLAALQTISRTLAGLGTTAFVATTMVRPHDNDHIRMVADHVRTDLGGARLLGLHLEGPFINPEKRGGILIDSIYPYTAPALNEIFALSGDALRMMTIATELPHSQELLDTLLQRSVIPALGHSNCTYEEARSAFASGVGHVTHLFNAMPGLHHRLPGPAAAVFEDERVTAQVICDGHHLHPAMVRLIYRLLGTKRTIVVTDGMRSLGLPDGTYSYNGKLYRAEGGAARYVDDGTLIGTTQSLGQMRKNLIAFTGASLPEVAKCCSENAARLLGMQDQIGGIQVGMQADLVLLNPDQSVYMTIVKGKIVYRNDA
ncbi:MAG TPA: N-acetylglucosamine-6-phosphate deacetylase [bacterium]|nr:N-acetylglucosamine-6-phosphate deacetylase [bacterium]HNT66494.1 N-acetylglucosamine-6-phosphate deacetylase [bacterium]